MFNFFRTVLGGAELPDDEDAQQDPANPADKKKDDSSLDSYEEGNPFKDLNKSGELYKRP